MRYVNFLILLCAGVLFSCRQDPKEILPEFAGIESLMWDHPDSALAQLERMPKPSRFDKLNDATWCLLYTQAWDKNYKKHTSDSLIHVAFRYFEGQEDGLRKAQAWFYKGSVLKDLGKLDEATECYVRARDLIGSFDDPLFASLICQTLGRIYREQDIYGLAFELFREAIHHVTRVPRCDSWSHAYSELGRTFAERKRLDSARYYFECSLENAKLIKDLKMQAMAISELGTVYGMEKNYVKALEFKKKDLALVLEQGDTFNFSAARYGLASVFYRMGELDSAEVYFKESMNTYNIKRLQTANLALHYIAKKQHRYDEAFQYIEQYRHYNDSINNMERTRIIAEAQKKYDNEKLENEKKDLLLEKDRLQKSLLGGGIILVVIALGYQRLLWLKERRLRISEKNMQEYISNLHDNEEKIFQNQALIQSLTLDLKDKENLEGVIREQVEQIDHLKNEIVCWESNNKAYQHRINEYIQSAQKNEERFAKLGNISTQNLSLKKREAFLTSYIYTHNLPFTEIKEKKHKFKAWSSLYKELNILHNDFYINLKRDFPFLTEEDLQVCCLIKSGFSTSQIADFFCISAPSITKKKYRIRERMNQGKEYTVSCNIALDLFLMNYPQTKLSASHGDNNI